MSIDSYRRYAVSCVGHTAQFYRPPQFLLRQERLLHASVLSVPANAVPMGLLVGKHILGFGFGMPSVQHYASAAQARVFVTCPGVLGNIRKLEQLLTTDDIAMEHMDYNNIHNKYLRHSVLYHIQDSYDTVASFALESCLAASRAQYKIYNVILAHHLPEATAAADVQKRLAKIGLGVSLYIICLFFELCRSFSKKCPLYLIVAIGKLWCNS